MEEESMEYEIDLRQLLAVMVKRLPVIFGITVTAALVAAALSLWVITPAYEASTRLVVNESQGESPGRGQDILVPGQVVATYNAIITDPAILTVTIERYELDASVQELERKATVQRVGDSQVIAITVRDSDIQRAAFIANALGETFRDELPRILNVDNVYIFSPAQVPAEPRPVSPRPLLNTAIALVLGLMLSVFIVFLLEFLDQSIRDERDLERELGLPVLGVIGSIDAVYPSVDELELEGGEDDAEAGEYPERSIG